MAPIPTAEIIASGRYLEDDFDPSTLTVSHLTGILTFHGARFASNSKKTQLVAAFNAQIAPRAQALLDERNTVNSSQASDRGIRDGVTGEQIGEPEVQEAPQPRRSSRRPSVRPSAEPEPTKPEASKRRRGTSTDAPATSRSTKGTRAAEPIVIEESEPEDEPEQRVRKVVKRDRDAPTTKRRVSDKFGSGGDDSRWEDNNVFQSGAESSPQPSRVALVKKAPTRRSGKAYRTPRSPSAEPAEDEEPEPSTSHVPSVSRFEPRLSVAASPRGSPRVQSPSPAPPRRSSLAPPPPRTPNRQEEEYQEEDELVDEPEYERSPSPNVDEEYNSAVSRKLGDISPASGAVTRRARTSSGGVVANSIRGFSYLAILLALVVTGLYKSESSSIGYCEAGSNSNTILRDLRANRLVAKECTARFFAPSDDSRIVDDVLCPLESFFPIPVPDSCTPCPNRAICTPHDVICKGAFIPQEQSLTEIPGLAWLANGMPGLGSVAFPPQCVEDRARLKMVGALGKSLESWLAKAKGDKLCKGLAHSTDGGDAKAWGVPRSQLKATIKRSVKKRIADTEFNTLFEEALTELERHGLIISETDPSGVQWVAALKSDMDMMCQMRVSATNAWDAWRRYLYSLAILTAGLIYTRRQITSRSAESRRVASLVQIALDTLRKQEISHHTDPVTYPQPFLSGMHLRDAILEDEHSMAVRRRVWDRVERVVEGNSNVRANVEIVNGDETRVWRWVGGGGAIGAASPQRRVQFAREVASQAEE